MNYERIAITSEALRAMQSEPSPPLKSLPVYLEYRTVFPAAINNGFLLPSSSREPGSTREGYFFRGKNQNGAGLKIF